MAPPVVAPSVAAPPVVAPPVVVAPPAVDVAESPPVVAPPVVVFAAPWCLCPDGLVVCPLVSRWNVLVGLTDLVAHRPGMAWPALLLATQVLQKLLPTAMPPLALGLGLSLCSGGPVALCLWLCLHPGRVNSLPVPLMLMAKTLLLEVRDCALDPLLVLAPARQGLHWLPPVLIAILLSLLALAPVLLQTFMACGSDNSPSVLLSATDLGSTAPNRDVTPGPGIAAPPDPALDDLLLALSGIKVIHGLNWLPCILIALLSVGLMFSLCGLLVPSLTSLRLIRMASLLGVTALGREVCPGPFVVLMRPTLLRHGLH